MSTFDLLILPGDGIGTEIMTEVDRIITWFNKQGNITFNCEHDLVGGAAYDAHGCAITDAAMEKAQKADAVIFGAVGGPKWDDVPYEARPEAGLLRLRKDLGLFRRKLKFKDRAGRRVRYSYCARVNRRRLFW